MPNPNSGIDAISLKDECIILTLIQGRNGDLHITYTWNRKKIKYVNVKLAGVPSL